MEESFADSASMPFYKARIPMTSSPIQTVSMTFGFAKLYSSINAPTWSR
jgi:hypothetical protein